MSASFLPSGPLKALILWAAAIAGCIRVPLAILWQ